MQQDSPNPFLNGFFVLMALGGWGSAIVSVTQIEQGWRLFNLALGSIASIAAIIYWIRKNRNNK